MPGPPEQLRGPHPHLYSRDVAARIGSPLPEAARAIIEEHKLRDYLLNPDHQDGRHKARVFASALGISQKDLQYLRVAILGEIPHAPVSAIVQTPYGLRCTVVVSITGLNDEHRDVITAWLIEEDRPPRLITAYVDV